MLPLAVIALLLAPVGNQMWISFESLFLSETDFALKALEKPVSVYLSFQIQLCVV